MTTEERLDQLTKEAGILRILEQQTKAQRATVDRILLICDNKGVPRHTLAAAAYTTDATVCRRIQAEKRKARESVRPPE